jgi:hypothetical protein
MAFFEGERAVRLNEIWEERDGASDANYRLFFILRRGCN